MAGNSLSTEKKTSFSTFVALPQVRQKIVDIIGGKKGDGFIASIVTAVSSNPQLQACDQNTILSSALLGAALNLSPSPQLGHFYMVPFKDNKNKRTVAQFQLGYKGYVQLAIRSAQYRNINVIALKQGEVLRWNELTEEIEYELMEDWEARENAPTVGYYAYFELTNGFRKAMYWTHSRMMAHAKKYSRGFESDLKNNTRYTFWSKDFDGMAYKTMLRQLISKWGIMSVEMQDAFTGDMAVIQDDGNREYVDNSDIEPVIIDEVSPQPAAAPEVDEALDVDLEQAFFG